MYCATVKAYNKEDARRATYERCAFDGIEWSVNDIDVITEVDSIQEDGYTILFI